MPIITHLIDAAAGKHPMSATRSSHWPTVRRAHLQLHPTCANCGGSEKLEVHHIHPFHLRPELELDPANLITLCEAGHGGINCHLAVGHLGTFKSFNADVAGDAARYLARLMSRPLAEVA